MEQLQSKNEVFEGLSKDSKVWVYTIDRILSASEQDSINLELNQFANDWQSHGLNLQARAQIVDERFIILMVDETAQGASGCSIDSSVRFITQLGEKWNFDPFNRMLVAVKEAEKVQLYPMTKFKELWKIDAINEESLVINTLVKNKSDFDDSWCAPIKDSWHKRMLN